MTGYQTAIMKKLNLALENCYGIRKLFAQLDFSAASAYAIYAPNGAMKSSLAQTFQDLADEKVSKDRIFPNRVCSRKVTDETGRDIPPESVLVLRPYDKEFGDAAKTSTLLVDNTLRHEFEKLHAEVGRAKDKLLKALQLQSQSKRDVAVEVSSTFTATTADFDKALFRIRDEILAQADAPFASVPYDVIFDEKVADFLESTDVKAAIEAYIKRQNELLAKSVYFKKGVFSYYNAAQIAKNLADHGFFAAKHTVFLNASQKLEISSQKQLEDLIQKEKDSITKDPALRKTFKDIDKLINKNVSVRGLQSYLEVNEDILPHLVNLKSFKELVWKSYIKTHNDLYLAVIEQYQFAEKRRREIEAEAARQRTQWEEVIDIFNSRFTVPFKLEVKNRIPVMLGEDAVPKLGFVFVDGTEQAEVDRDALLEALSTGERKAYYILNILFELQRRRRTGQETLAIFDDIADSFDYKNKYAIIQYLKELSEEPNFRQILLTHNFDFFRTVNSRFVKYQQCLMATKNSKGITLEPAAGIKNVFQNDWKLNFFKDPLKRVASIPFLRNLIEYTRGDNDPVFRQLTSLLHWKADTQSITEADLASAYKYIFAEDILGGNTAIKVYDVIMREADRCLSIDAGVNFENKIVLSIAIRLSAERYMVARINDKATADIEANQTPRLLAEFKRRFFAETDHIKVLDKVVLMTPENLHLNAFMYEPILDMSDEHLKRLYKEVKTLA